MQEKKKVIQWIKEHKKELILAGISFGTLFLVILGIQNREKLKTVWDSLKETIQPLSMQFKDAAITSSMEVSTEQLSKYVGMVDSDLKCIPFRVCGHIRNLPDGCHASPQKIESALKYNIVLLDGQTWVDSYIKGGIAA